MSDKELLELAAKASGMTFSAQENPLERDDLALRLAVKVLNWPHGGCDFDNAVAALYAAGQLPKDPYAATRLAIVRAVAVIGGKV